MKLEVISELKKQDASSQIGGFYRQLEQIEAGKYFISIQGSEKHYSSPRKTLEISDYTHMEIAIFKDGLWLPTISRFLKKFDRYNELIERCDDVESKCPVYGWVSVELINDLYLFLKKDKP